MNQTRKEALKIVGNGCRVRPFDEHDVTDGTWQYVKRADAFRAVAMVCDLNEELVDVLKRLKDFGHTTATWNIALDLIAKAEGE